MFLWLETKQIHQRSLFWISDLKKLSFIISYTKTRDYYSLWLKKKKKKKKNMKTIYFLFLSLYHWSHPELCFLALLWYLQGGWEENWRLHSTSDVGKTDHVGMQGVLHIFRKLLLFVIALYLWLFSSSQAPSPGCKLLYYNTKKVTSTWQIQRFVFIVCCNQMRTACIQLNKADKKILRPWTAVLGEFYNAGSQ